MTMSRSCVMSAAAASSSASAYGGGGLAQEYRARRRRPAATSAALRRRVGEQLDERAATDSGMSGTSRAASPKTLARHRRVEQDRRHAVGDRLERRHPEALVLRQEREHSRAGRTAGRARRPRRTRATRRLPRRPRSRRQGQRIDARLAFDCRPRGRAAHRARAAGPAQTRESAPECVGALKSEPTNSTTADA